MTVFLAALFAAAVLSLIFGVALGWRRPGAAGTTWSGVLFFFVVVWLTTWAFTAWARPGGSEPVTAPLLMVFARPEPRPGRDDQVSQRPPLVVEMELVYAPEVSVSGTDRQALEVLDTPQHRLSFPCRSLRELGPQDSLRGTRQARIVMAGS